MVQPKQVASDRVEVLCGDIAAFGLRESGLQRVCESEAKENARWRTVCLMQIADDASHQGNLELRSRRPIRHPVPILLDLIGS